MGMGTPLTRYRRESFINYPRLSHISKFVSAASPIPWAHFLAVHLIILILSDP